jgi:hypothetical protein
MAKALAGEVTLGRRANTESGVTAIEILGLSTA